jgi:hypothetical protein
LALAWDIGAKFLIGELMDKADFVRTAPEYDALALILRLIVNGGYTSDNTLRSAFSSHDPDGNEEHCHIEND